MVSFGLFFFFKQKTAYEIMPSLVGSEMCIRDSPRRELRATPCTTSTPTTRRPRPSCSSTSSASVRTSGDRRHTKPPESGREQGKGEIEARGVVLLQRAWSSGCLCGRRRHLEVAERRRLGNLQGGEDLALAGRRQ